MDVMNHFAAMANPGEPEMSADFLTVKRWHIVLPLLLMQLWPIHVVIRANLTVGDYESMFNDLIGPGNLPAITNFVINTCHYWFILPTITIVLAGLCFSKRITSMTLPAITLVLTILFADLLEILWAEGIYAPMGAFFTKITG